MFLKSNIVCRLARIFPPRYVSLNVHGSAFGEVAFIEGLPSQSDGQENDEIGKAELLQL